MQQLDPTRLPFPLLAGTAVLMVGSGLQNSLLGLRGVAEGFPNGSIGLLVSGYFAGFVLGALRAPGWIGRVGHVRAFAALASLASVIVLLHSLVVHPLPWLAARFASGACLSGLTIIVESWLNTVATAADRGRILAAYMVVVLGSLAGAQLLIGLAPVTEFTLFAAVSAAFSLSLVPLLMFVGPEPTVPEVERRLSIRRLLVTSPVGAVAAAAGGATWGIAAGLGAVHAQRSGLSTTGVTLFAAALLGGGLLTQFPIGALGDRLDRRLVIALVAGAAAVAAAATALVPNGAAAWLILGGVAIGASTLPIYSLALATVVERVDEGDIVPASATVMLLSGVGSAVGPLVVGAAQGTFGRVSFPLTIAAICGATALLATAMSGRGGGVAHRVRLVAPVPARSTLSAALLALPARRVIRRRREAERPDQAGA